MKYILGISAFYHDSAACLILEGEIISCAQEERFNRCKNSAKFPVSAIRYCLEEAGISIDDLDAVVFYDKPFLKFERLLQTFYSLAPRGLISFLKAIPSWLDEKLFLKNKIREGLKEVGPYDKKKLNLLFSGHHLSHAASAFYPSPFETAAILTVDGVGEWSTATISIGTGNNIKMLKEMHFPHSIGLLYSAFTYFLGFEVNSGEYKLMGLASYGHLNSTQTQAFISKIKTELVAIKDDGSIWLNQSYFDYTTGLKMIKPSKWENLFNLETRCGETHLEQSHCNLALAIQQVTQEILMKIVREVKKLTKSDFLCMAGGVALNCSANTEILKSKIFKDIYIQPAAGDAGAAIGAALAVHYMYYDAKRKPELVEDPMKGTYLGPKFDDKAVRILNRRKNATATPFSDFSDLVRLIATEISKGKVVGWFQDRMEFGPRALGNRSILADPRVPEMQQLVNQKVKFREGFRPFAPAVLFEDASEYFEIGQATPYMLFTPEIKNIHRKEIPVGFNTWTMKDRLNYPRSQFPAITHIDFSSRVQTVTKSSNPKFWALLSEFKLQTGHSILLNTSFNVRNEPIVCSPEDAYNCFMSTNIDILVINNYVYYRDLQP